MRLTVRQLNRATLERQLLLRRAPMDVVEGVRRVVALQAQEPASPYLALWNRIAGFDPADLDAAFRDHSVVKATLMRITMHAVHASDYPAFHDAMEGNLRASRLADRRYTEAGLTTADADAVVPVVLDFAGRPRSRVEIEAMLEARHGDGKRRLWWAIRTFGKLLHAPNGGPWTFRQPSAFVSAASRLPLETAGGSVPYLVRRYLEGFGPASVQDVAQFALLQRAVVREALATLAAEVVQLDGPDGAELFDLAGAGLPPEDSPAPPRLLPMWDSTLLAYADRSRVIPPDLRRLVTRMNGDVLPTLLVDGYVAGVWRPLEGGIEATAFHALSDEAWSGLAAEAAALTAFLADREPMVYRRYSHWWSTLPTAETRILAG